jgi:hypothetical protein
MSIDNTLYICGHIVQLLNKIIEQDIYASLDNNMYAREYHEDRIWINSSLFHVNKRQKGTRTNLMRNKKKNH